MLLGISKFQILIFLENLTFDHNGMSILFVNNYFCSKCTLIVIKFCFDMNKALPPRF